MPQFNGSWYIENGTYWTSLWATGGHPNGQTTSGGRLPIQQWAVRRWVSEIDGVIDISGILQGGSTIGRIFVDGVELLSQSISGQTTNYNLRVAVQKGTFIDFAIDPQNNNDLGDSTLFTVKILSNIAPQHGVLSFSNSQFTINEDGTPITQVTLIRTGGSDGEITVTLTPSNGTATAGSDYNNSPINVTFADGETSKTVNLTAQASQGLSFDGNSYVNVADRASLVASNTITIEAWINPNGDGVSTLGGGGILVNKEGEYEVARYADGTIRWAFANTDPTWLFIDTGYVAPLNQWNHIAITYDSGLVKTYANGILVHTYNGSGTIADVHLDKNDFRIGGRQQESQFFQGSIDDVRIWNKARTQAEIQADFNRELIGNETGLVSYWNFNSVNSNTVQDLSSNHNNGTLVGAQSTTGFSTSLIINDTIYEPTETVNLTLSNPTGGATLGTQQNAVLNIIDNDANSGTIQFSNTAYSINENGTPVTAVTLTRSNGSDGAVTVTLNLVNGTATAPSDYNSSPITVNFANGETSKTVTIPIVNDTQLEPDETVNLTLSNPQGGVVLGTQTTATLTIINDDLPQRGIISLNGNSYTVNENGTANISLTRSNGSDGEVSVTLTPSNGTATSGSDYNNLPVTVTFTDGQTSKTVTIPIIDDTVYEPTETVNLTLSNPTGGATLGTPKTAILSIIDNDAVPGVIQFSNTLYSVNENGTPVNAVTLTRSNGSDGEVSVTLNLANGTATAGSDYNNSSITVNFANGETTKTVTIPIIDDNNFENTETLQLTLANPTNGATIGTQNSAIVSIIDNDFKPTLTVNINADQITEGNSIQGTVTRNTDTTTALTVTLVRAC
jgi:hypothetical protein